MKKGMLVIGAAAAGIILMVSVLLSPTLQQAQAATYQPTTNIKAWTLNEDYAISDPSFYIRPSYSTSPGYVKITADFTNNGDGAISGLAYFFVNGKAYDVVPYSVAANGKATVSAKQFDVSLGLMEVLIDMVKVDGANLQTLLAEKSMVIRITEKWEIISVGPEVYYNAPTNTVAFKMGNDKTNKNNFAAGLIEIYTEYLEGSSLTGKQINYIEIPIKRVGDPQGIIEVGIFNTENADGAKPTFAKVFGRINASALVKDDLLYYRFYTPSFYSIPEVTHIGIKYEHANPTGNHIEVYGTTNDFLDNARTRYSYGNDRDFMTSVVGADASMRLGQDAFINGNGCSVNFEGFPPLTNLNKPWELMYDITYMGCVWAFPQDSIAGQSV